jgi:hypothetical protein
VLTAWEDYCARPQVASALGSRCRDAGFTVEFVEPFSVLNTRLTPETFGHYQLEIVEEYVAAHDEIALETVAAWADDLRAIDDRGETFFSQTSALYGLRVPG